MIASMTSSTTKEYIADIINLGHVGWRYRIFAIIIMAKLLLDLGSQALPEWLGPRPLVCAYCAGALVWAQTILGMRNAYTTTTLKNELIIPDFGNEMFSGGPRSKANLMIRVGTALAENKRTFNFIVPRNTTDITSIQVTKSERIVRRNCVKDLFCTKKLLLFRHLILGDLVFKSFT